MMSLSWLCPVSVASVYICVCVCVYVIYVISLSARLSVGATHSLTRKTSTHPGSSPEGVEEGVAIFTEIILGGQEKK